MGFLMNFMRNRGVVNAPSSFEGLTEEALETHLRIDQYGNFQLTDAIRPSYNLQVIPEQGFRHDSYRDESTRTQVPVLMAAITRHKLFDVFVSLLDPLGETVDVVLETSHSSNCKGHADFYREHIDMSILKSMLWEYEQLLTDDGCTGIAVLNPSIPKEVQFDEHKLLIVYGDELDEYERLLQSCCIQCRDEMRFITEAEHVHSSSDTQAQQFRELAVRLGTDQEW